MLNCFAAPTATAIAIRAVTAETFSAWVAQQSEPVKNWLKAVNFTAKPESFCLLPSPEGTVSQVLVGINNPEDFWAFGNLPCALPAGIYKLEGEGLNTTQQARAALAWGLGAYQFARYKKPSKIPAQLIIPEDCSSAEVANLVESIYLVRDLINTPMENMGPVELAQAAVDLGKEFNAEIKQIIGDELLTQNYPLIHAVGRASAQAPRLIDLCWGDVTAPKVTLVGKGVCFDSGGLDLKNSANMLLMKKDMGGAAHALGLARMIMAAKLPVRLRVLIPAVENAVSSNAFRPGDVIKSRKGLTVEIGNTDAEGRLVLADALTEAVSEQPELLLDFATLTGAARVAVGTDIGAFFTDNHELAEQLMQCSYSEQDPLWRMPLFAPYRKMLDSPIADLNNTGASSYGGAITAALFLQEFVPNTISWLHFDFMAWNLTARPGRPQGAEANTLRAVFSYLANKFREKLG